MIVNVRHTGIVVSDLENVATFYRKLGFEDVSQDIEKGNFIEQVTGIENVELEWIKMKAADGYLLELIKYHSHPLTAENENAVSNKLGCSHIAFTVENIDAACELIDRSGGSVVNKAATAPNGKVKVAYCHDPEGVLMEIVEELD